LLTQQEDSERETLKTKKTQVLAPQGSRKGEQEQSDRNTVKANVKEDRQRSRLTNAAAKWREARQLHVHIHIRILLQTYLYTRTHTNTGYVNI